MKEIAGYEGLYAVDKQGNVWSLVQNSSRRKGKIRPYVNTGGYRRVNLYDARGKATKHYVHRLVAQTFLPNPKSLPHVNHINADKDNNSIDNLEWCSEKYNIAESRRLGLQKKDRAVRAFSVITGETKFYSCIKEAARAFTGKDWAFDYKRKRHGDEFYHREWRIEVMPL